MSSQNPSTVAAPARRPAKRPPKGPTQGAEPPRAGKWSLSYQVGFVFLLWHIGCVLATGVAPIKRFFEPLIGFYTDGLRLATTWGMFSRPPRRADTLIEAVRSGGEIVVLSSSYQFERTLRERIEDTRLRKIQAKLEEEGDRTSFGAPYLDYYCRVALGRFTDVVRVRIRVAEPDRLDDANQVVARASERVVMERPCPAPPGAVPAAPARPQNPWAPSHD